MCSRSGSSLFRKSATSVALGGGTGTYRLRVPATGDVAFSIALSRRTNATVDEAE